MGDVMRNIALFGHMGSGKTTIADALSRAGYQRVSFAAPLKAVAELAYGKIDKGAEYKTSMNLPDVNLDGGHPLTAMKSGRQLLQEIGQSIKDVDRDFWLKCFFRTADTFADTPLVVDDGRFNFEFTSLQSAGWLTVGINTHQSVRMQRYESIYGRVPTDGELNHQSEVEVPGILQKCQIIVQGTDDAYDNARKILRIARDT
jgi:hypothetical protein